MPDATHEHYRKAEESLVFASRSAGPTQQKHLAVASVHAQLAIAGALLAQGGGSDDSHGTD